MIGIILAGGAATRMGGGDKGERTIGGVPIIERVLTTLSQQCNAILLSANGEPSRFARLGIPVVGDKIEGRLGPLAGILSGLDETAARFPAARFAVTVPADAPFLPSDLVARLADQRVADRAAIVCAASGGRWHHATSLWAIDVRNDLRSALLEEGMRKMSAFVARHPVAHVAWPCEPVDPFFNVNTPEDLARAEQMLQALPRSSDAGHCCVGMTDHL